MLDIQTPNSTMEILKVRYKQKRLEFNLTQEGLAKKSGVSLGSLKRFEASGEISLKSLLKISFILECLDEFKFLATPKTTAYKSINDVIKKEKTKKRGTIK